MRETEVFESINNLHKKMDIVISNQNTNDINNAVVENRVQSLEDKNRHTRSLMLWFGTSIIALLGIFKFWEI